MFISHGGLPNNIAIYIITENFDNTGTNVVSSTIRVENKYTLNCYITTSRFMVIRQNSQAFAARDLESILDIMISAKFEGKPVCTNDLNALLIDKIETALGKSTAECVKCHKKC